MLSYLGTKETFPVHELVHYELSILFESNQTSRHIFALKVKSLFKSLLEVLSLLLTAILGIMVVFNGSNEVLVSLFYLVKLLNKLLS